MLVDSHCHLNFKDFHNQVDRFVKSSEENGIGFLQTICTKPEEFPEIIKIAANNKQVYCSYGIHPCNVPLTNQDILKSKIILSVLKHPKVISIGETGLDYHYSPNNPKQQQISFIEHIKAAQASGLPLVIHTRDAEEDTYEILKENLSKKNFKAVMHCFTGTMQFAKKCLDLGFYISFSGIITFQNAESLREVVKLVPSDRILVETDAPFLTPVPHRGKPNEPAFVRYVAETIADVKGVSFKEIAESTTNNFFKLFDKAPIS